MRSTRSSKLVWQNHENILLLDQRVCQTKKNFWPIILYSLWYFSWVENKQCESPHCNILVMDVVMVKKKFWLILLCCGFKTGYYICLASPIKGSVPFICHTHMKKWEQRFSMLVKDLKVVILPQAKKVLLRSLSSVLQMELTRRGQRS